MAYNKAFNPDALPAHVEPEQAAQALANLQGNRRPSPHLPVSHSTTQHNTSASASPPRRLSPAAQAARESYRPVSTQQTPTYHYESPQSRPPPPPKPSSHPINNPHRPSSGTPTPSNPPRTPQPPPDPDSSDLYPLFLAANTSRTGALTPTELSSALVNADYTPFDPLTIRTMTRLFSSSPHPSHQTITYPEFQNLWRFLSAWRTLFERFDEDHSGRISQAEFGTALVSFGYRLSPPFTGVLYAAFNARPDHNHADHHHPGDDGGGGGFGGNGGGRRNSVEPPENRGMGFDRFVQACISLKRMTDVFKGYDEDRDGYVTLSFEEFLTEILRLRE